MSRHKILIATAIEDSARRLKEALVSRGFSVDRVKDGREAVRQAVATLPSAALIDFDVPLVGARAFAEVLRRNPKTQDMHVFVIGGDEVAQGRIAHITGWVQTPFNAEEVAARVKQVLGEGAAEQSERVEFKDLTGDLRHMSPADLLQVLSSNRRTGTLDLRTPTLCGSVFIRDGEIIDAQVGESTGLKALYRTMGVTEGTFNFTLEDPTRPRRIEGRMDGLLMEGMRQIDELARITTLLPRHDDLLEIVGMDKDMTPAEQEVLGLIGQYQRFGDVLDRSERTDLETGTVVSDLMNTGKVRVTGQRTRSRFAQPEIMERLREAVVALRRPGVVGPPRLAWFLKDKREASRFRSAVALGVGGYLTPRGISGASLGLPVDLGRLDLGEGLTLEMTALPLDVNMAPLWFPFLVPAIGVGILQSDRRALEQSADVCKAAATLDLRVLSAVSFAAESPKELLRADFFHPDGASKCVSGLIKLLIDEDDDEPPTGGD